MRGQNVDWEMSLRYKYPTINADTYRMNIEGIEERVMGEEEEGILGGEEGRMGKEENRR